MEGNLVDVSSETTGGCELVKAGEKVGTGPPLGAMKLSEEPNGANRRLAPLYATCRSFSGQTTRRAAEISAEIRRTGSQVVIKISRECYPRGNCEKFTADVIGQDGEQPRVGSDPLQIKEACSRSAQPVPDKPIHDVFFTLDRQEIEVIWTEWSGAQHPKGWQAEPPPFLQGDATEESVAVDDQQEARPSITVTD